MKSKMTPQPRFSETAKHTPGSSVQRTSTTPLTRDVSNTENRTPLSHRESSLQRTRTTLPTGEFSDTENRGLSMQRASEATAGACQGTNDQLLEILTEVKKTNLRLESLETRLTKLEEAQPESPSTPSSTKRKVPTHIRVSCFC